MPTNKNALNRYFILDELLSDFHHCYSCLELTGKVNAQLEAMGESTVSKRCIEMDLNYLAGSPFYAEIARFRSDGKNVVRYEPPGFSIFRKEISNDERLLLSEALKTLGQFKGLDNFEWLDRLKVFLGVVERPHVIEFSHNPLYMADNNFLGILFTAISSSQVVELHYHTFANPEVKSILFHPYLLKEYNSRWYVIGGFDPTGFILNFALDRLDAVIPRPALPFLPPSEEFQERHDDIVGVTLLADRPVEEILLWVSDETYPYIQTKPIHLSQKNVSGEKENEIRQKYPCPSGGKIISLNCIRNRELLQTIFFYMNDVVVLSPKVLRDEVCNRLSALDSHYALNNHGLNGDRSQ